jgi:dihydroorotase-like cyclic amidohydrolase
VEPVEFFSKSRNTPFKGFELTGKTVMTVLNGNIIRS